MPLLHCFKQDAARDLEGGSASEEAGDDEYPGVSELRRRSGASPTAAEVARFGAAKERKHALASAIAAFNRCAEILAKQSQQSMYHAQSIVLEKNKTSASSFGGCLWVAPDGAKSWRMMVFQ